MSKQIDIKVLFFDEKECFRCKSTISILEEAINAFQLLHPLVKINYKKSKVPEEKITISPTILINNIDLESLILKQDFVKKVSECKDCSCIVNKKVCCRDYQEGLIDTEAIKIVLQSQI